MHREQDDQLTRRTAKALMAVLDQYESDRDADRLRAGLLQSTAALRASPDLHALGVKREGNHINNSKYLYYDGLLQLTLDELPHGKKIPPHDHGIWEALIICSGRLTHSVYERADDGKTDGYADLRVIEDRICSPGDIAMVVPPSDIHAFTALPGDRTFVLTIVGGKYSDIRRYYSVESKSYVMRTPKALRESGALETVS